MSENNTETNPETATAHAVGCCDLLSTGKLLKLEHQVKCEIKKRFGDEGYFSEMERLELYESEHERLKKELALALGSGDASPSFCDLVALARDLQR